ncbi:MAG: SIMPL domain-containing protein [Acidobacteriota bacterium]
MLRLCTTTVLVSLALTAALHAAENELPQVTVFGTATTQVTPDQMDWHLRVNNKGPKLPGVAEQHTTIVQQVMTLLKQCGIKDSDAQMSQMEFGENWEYRGESSVREGYFASTRISFRTREMATYRPLWLGLAEIPSLSVEGVNYDHSKRIEYRNETRRKALLAAKEKAADMARTLGSEIAEPLRIEEDLSVSEGGWPGRNYASNTMAVEPGESTDPDAVLVPGMVPIQARVKVSFRLVTHSD